MRTKAKISHLLSTRRFLPLFVTQFLGALNDNFFKQAMIILITYQLAAQSSLDSASLTALAGAMLILPFILFSSISGPLADRYDKARLIRIVKTSEVLIMLFAGYTLYLQTLSLMYLALFLLGTQSAFFGPLKYSTLPFHLEKSELLGANALIEAATFIAILLGSIIGGLIVRSSQGLAWTAIGMLTIALIGLFAAWFVPSAKPQAPDQTISFRLFRDSIRMIRTASLNQRVQHAMLGICWFWAIGSIILSLIPILAAQVGQADERVAVLFLSIFSISIGLGAIVTNRLLKGEISYRLSGYGIVNISLTLVLLGLYIYWVDRSIQSNELKTIGEFLAEGKSWLLMGLLFMMGFSVGPFITPLYATIQHYASDDRKGSAIAASNILNSLFILASALLVILLRDVLLLSLTGVCLVASVANLAALYHINILHRQSAHDSKLPNA